MSAEIIDVEQQKEPTQEPVAPVVETKVEAPAQDTKTEKPEDAIPEKYRGKSLEDLVKMHAEAEKLIGRQGVELGSLRQTHDEFIRASLAGKAKTEAPKHEEAPVVDDDVEFFANPKQAIKKIIDSDPELKQIREDRVKAAHEKARAALAAKHPDGQQILQDPQFQQWVTGSPVRLDLLNRADKNYDVDAAHELFDTWKQLRGIAVKSQQTTAPDTSVAQKEALKAATVPSGSTAATGDGKKFYNRSDIMKLMQTDPRRYEAMGDEILLAYQEGRIRNR